MSRSARSDRSFYELGRVRAALAGAAAYLYVALVAVGCGRSAGTDAAQGGASAKPASAKPAAATATALPPDAPDAPAVTTVILEERRGADTLRLYDVVAARGFLKPDARALAADAPGVRFGVSLLGAAGDTLYREGFRSALDVGMDVAEPDGTFRHADVVHDVVPHVVRYAGTAPAAVAVVVRDAAGATVATQVIPLASARADAPARD